MNRINIIERDSGERRVIGWFDYDAAEKFAEDTDWDGSNHVSVNTGSSWTHEMLLRTKTEGQWVLQRSSNYQDSLDSYEYVSGDQAREWLIRNHRDEDVARFFGELEEERGPGRPEVGGAVHVRLGELLGRVDAFAAESKVTRAEAIRELVLAGLSQVPQG